MRTYDVAELAQTLFEEIGDAAFITDVTTMRLVNVNPMAMRMTGVSRADLLRIPLDQLFRSDDDEGLTHLNRALHTTQTFHSQDGYFLARRNTNTWTPVNLTLTRLHTDRGELGLILARDVTERIQAQEKLRLANATLERRVQERTADLGRVNESLREQIANHERATEALQERESLFRGAFEHTAVAMVLTDIENRFVRVNAAFAKLFGYPPDELLGMTMADITHPGDLVESYAQRQTLLHGHSEYFQIEKRYRHKSGTTFWGLTNVSLVRDSAGQPRQYIGQVQDITQRKRAEQRLTTQHAVVSILAESRTLREAAPRLLQVVCEMTGWDFGGLWLVDHKLQTLSCMDLWHVEWDAVAEFRDLTQQTRLGPGEGFPGRVWAAGRPAWMADITQDSNFPRFPAASNAGIRSGFGFPIWLGHQVLGVIEFFSRESRLPDADLLRMFDSLGSQIGQFLEQQQSQESLLLFRTLIDRTTDGIEVIDPETGRFLDVNERACQAHGYTREEYLNLNVSDIDPVVAVRPWEELRDGQPPVALQYFETLHRRKDQSTFPVEINLNFIHLDRDYFVAVVRDISDRLRAQEDLLLRDRAIRAVSQGILITDPNQPDNPIVYASPGFERLTGYTSAEIVGRNCRFLQGKDSDRDGVSRVREAIQTGQPCTVELLNYRKDGTTFWNELSLSPVRDDLGRLSHFVGVLTDVTNRRSLEEQLRQSQKMEAIGRLAGGVAHDFNNLLTIINGYSELLLEILPTEFPQREMIREIGMAGKRAAGLTRQLLAFSRKAIIEPTVLNLRTVVTDVKSMLARIVGEDIQLTVVADPAVGEVKADVGQMEQVLLNLLVNARDAIPRGGRITIELRNVDLDKSYSQTHADARPGPHVLLAVSDTGCGMDATTMARMFEPFFTTKGDRGTGLGLATVHGIVKQSGGHVNVYSELKRGTTFKVYLPRVNVPSTTSEVRANPSILPAGHETILLVEDEDSLRVLTHRILLSCGYTILQARDGEDAIQVAEHHGKPIDLLLTDVILPRLSGRDIAERISVIHPGISVMYMSGYTDDAVVRHGILEAQVAFLQKPFSPAALAKKVRQTLDG